MIILQWHGVRERKENKGYWSTINLQFLDKRQIDFPLFYLCVMQILVDWEVFLYQDCLVYVYECVDEQTYVILSHKINAYGVVTWYQSISPLCLSYIR